MKYELVFTASYTRRAVRFLRRHPELRSQHRKTLEFLVAAMTIIPVHVGRHDEVHR